MKLKDSWFVRNLSWILVISVILIVWMAWVSIFSGTANIKVVTIFPLLGLLAWAIMWTHYVMTGLDVVAKASISSNYYWLSTRIAVLLLILLHPFLLAWKQWQLIGALPPGSFYSYVASGLKAYVMLGSLSLLIFLSFELFNHFKNKKWVKKHYWLIELSQIAAMILIWFHALKLGNTMSIGWFKIIWIFMGILLLPCFYLVMIRARSQNDSLVDLN